MSETEYREQVLLFNRLVVLYCGALPESYLYKEELLRGIQQMEPALRNFEQENHPEDYAAVEAAQ